MMGCGLWVWLQIASLKRMKKELESRIEELEDEIDEMNVVVDSAQQVTLTINNTIVSPVAELLYMYIHVQ